MLIAVPAATDWLAVHGYDRQMGARPLGRVIQEHIKKPLADEVLFGKLKRGGVVKVTVGPSYLTIGKEYTDWNIGATYTWGHLTFGVSYVDTDKSLYSSAGHNISKAGVLGSLTASF